MENLTIKKITSLETYAVRHPVLRAGRPLESCKFEGDDLPETFHLGAYFQGMLVGVVTLLEMNDMEFNMKKQFQLRGMAILADYQKRGFGELLVVRAEEEARLRNGNLIWMNARLTALGFYKRLGYKVVGAEFVIPQVGPHYKMVKYL